MSIFIEGKTVYLRALTLEDATPEYQSWLNDSEVTQHLETGRFPVSLESVSSFIEAHSDRNDALLLGIFLKDSDQHIGNIKLSPINWVHRWAELGIMIGSKDVQGKGIGTEVTKLVCKHAFDRLNLNRVSLGVIESNTGAIRCYEKAGFVSEGKARASILSAGKFYDTIKMGLLADDFRKQNESTC